MEELKYHYKYPHPSVTTDCVIFGFDGRNWGRFRLIHFLRHQKCTLAATKVETAPTDAKTVPMDNKTAPTDDKTEAMFGKNRRLLIPPAINVNRSR